MTVFLASLAGIPPLGGWFAKFVVIQSLFDAATVSSAVLGVIFAVNTVIAFGYYARVLREMWFSPVSDGDSTPIKVPAAIATALVLTAVATVASGVLPQLVGRFGDISTSLAL
jgi:NADH-quinone oxidoreductase subunit N